MKPFFSIGVTTYNRPEMLKQTLMSIETAPHGGAGWRDVGLAQWPRSWVVAMWSINGRISSSGRPTMCSAMRSRAGR